MATHRTRKKAALEELQADLAEAEKEFASVKRTSSEASRPYREAEDSVRYLQQRVDSATDERDRREKEAKELEGLSPIELAERIGPRYSV